MTRYRLGRDESLDEGVRRVMSGLSREAAALLSDPGDDIEDAIHEARKNCKKARGMARLVRPAVGDDYSEVNRLYRDAARRLSPIRDPHTLVSTVDALARLPLVPPGELSGARDELARRSVEASALIKGPERQRLDDAVDLIEAAESMAAHWNIQPHFDSIAGGLRRTYSRGAKGYRNAMETRHPEQFHEWRKRVKYLWYQIRLLRDAAPSLLKPLGRVLHDLSDALGDAHDLVLLGAVAPELDITKSERQSLAIVAGGVRVDLEERALRLGRRLYAESPDDFVARIEAYWDAWMDGPELAAGEIGDVYQLSEGGERVDLARQLFAVSSRD